MSQASVNIVRVTNPFDPTQSVLEDGSWAKNKTITEFVGPVPASEYVISINGKVIQKEDYETTTIIDGDYVVICPIPEGDDGGKGVLRIVAFIAVAYFAGVGATAIGGNLGLGAAATGALEVGLMIAGSMLVNALLPVKPPKDALNDLDTSKTYGIDGAQNTSDEGIPVPVCYGTFRMAGNLINSYLENIGNTQNMYLLYNAGEGPVASLEDVEINDQPVENFQNVDVQTRIGNTDQDVIQWFSDTVVPRNLNTLLTTSWTTFTTIGTVDKLRFDFTLPNGLFGLRQQDGVQVAIAVDLEVEYKKTTDSVWTSMPRIDYITGTTQSGTRQELIAAGRSGVRIIDVPVYVPVYEPLIRIQDASRAPVRRSITSPPLEEAQYDVRIRRTSSTPTSVNVNTTWTTTVVNIPLQFSQDDIYITDINEIITEDIAYVNTALVALKITLDEQINSLPRVTYLNKGVLCEAYNESTDAWEIVETSNPAWITLDMMTNPRYGMGIPDNRIKMEEIRDWAAFCTTNSLEFNGVFDTKMSMWDALQYVMRAGRAQIVNVGTRYGVVIERQDTAKMMFSMANIEKGSFSQNWLQMSERANEIEVTFFDKDDKYKQRTIRIYDPTALSLGAPQRPSNVTLYGVTDYDQAYAEAVLHLNMNKYLQQTAEFQVPMEALGCNVGDVIYVQHDMPQWGYAGRLNSGSTTTILELDREVPMSNGSSYTVLVLFDSVLRFGPLLVDSLNGNTVGLAGYDGSTDVKRLVVNGTDYEVTDIVDLGGGDWGVEVTDSTGISVSDTYNLYDTDVMVEKSVVNPAVGPDEMFSTITVSSAFAAAPDQYRDWMFGEVTQVKKPFRVKSISQGSDVSRKVSCIEYNDSVYGGLGTAPIPNYSALPSSVEHVTIDDIQEDLILVNNTLRTKVTVYFSSTEIKYRRSKVFVARNDGEYQEMGWGFDRFSVEADDDEIIFFKVLAYDANGSSAPEPTAPFESYQVLGKADPPNDVTNFSGKQSENVVIFQWDQVSDLDVAGYEIRYNEINDWDTATVLTSVTKGTNITSAAVPPGLWYTMIKAIDASGNYSTNHTAYVTNLNNAFEIIQSHEEAPEWINPLTGWVKTWDGKLIIDSTLGANAHTNAELFEQFVPYPVATCSYESIEFDLGKDASARLWTANSNYFRSDAVGTNVSLNVEVDYYQEGGSYDGYEPWNIGSIDFRYAKVKITLDTSVSKPIMTAFNVTIDNPVRTESRDGILISDTGTAITFTTPFINVPRIFFDNDDSQVRIGTATNKTINGFTGNLFNTSDTQVSGVGKYTAIGV